MSRVNSKVLPWKYLCKFPSLIWTSQACSVWWLLPSPATLDENYQGSLLGRTFQDGTKICILKSIPGGPGDIASGTPNSLQMYKEFVGPALFLTFGWASSLSISLGSLRVFHSHNFLLRKKIWRTGKRRKQTPGNLAFSTALLKCQFTNLSCLYWDFWEHMLVGVQLISMNFETCQILFSH